MADPDRPTATALVIAGQLRLAANYLQDSRLLAASSSRNAANLLFQSAEATLIAVMTSEKEHVGRADQHQLAVMRDRLPDTNPLKPRFGEIEHLTGYATTFRYVTAAGRIKPGPSDADLEAWQATVAAIIELCRSWFGVDLTITSTVPAKRTAPIRESEGNTGVIASKP